MARTRLAKKLGVPYEYHRKKVTEKKAQSKVPRIKLSKPKCYLDYLREEEKKHPNARVDYKNTRSLFKRKG